MVMGYLKIKSTDAFYQLAFSANLFNITYILLKRKCCMALAAV
jgi:hypothetical protein